jgi:peptidoglycan-N-acetylglucosamine deacetylase
MITKSPLILKKLFPELTWEVVTTEKSIYLTFDDGPNPDTTCWILECLKKYNIKATFFCVGENVCNYPDIYDSILNQDHTTGNHSYNHLSGWNTNNNKYYENISKAEKFIDSNLFRPPYGRISPTQIRTIKKKFNIIMWSVLTYDYDKNVTKEKCLENSIRHTNPGSIIVFHDSTKAFNNVKYSLPLFLEHFLKLDYNFKTL